MEPWVHQQHPATAKEKKRKKSDTRRSDGRKREKLFSRMPAIAVGPNENELRKENLYTKRYYIYMNF